MNAGTDYAKAKRQAQANADYTKTPRWVSGYNGVWWIDQTPTQGAERIDPQEKPKGYQSTHCEIRQATNETVR